MQIPSSTALGNLPVALRADLIAALNEIIRNFREGRWEPSELNGGKLCEVVYTILSGYVAGNYPAQAQKPKNMVDDCRALENAGPQFPRSIRIQIPRLLVALYEIRNNRGVGHVGGDVDPNQMDAFCVMHLAKWLVAELVRIFHNVDTKSAAYIVEALVAKEVPVVWETLGKKRVLDTKLKMKDKTLLLLYASTDNVHESELVDWVEHSNPSVFRRDILRPAHKAKLLEYDTATKVVRLSPLGVQYVERNLPLSLVAP